jgi:hypothetical protein
MMKLWQAALNETPSKGREMKVQREREREREREPKVQARKSKPKMGHKGSGKGTNYVSKSPLVARSILQKERET